MSESTRGRRVPLGFSCRHCGSADTWVEERFESAPLNTYSLAGAQNKLTGRFHPYAVCDGCGHVSRGEVVSGDEQ